MKTLSKLLSRLKHGILIALFILVPFAGAFHQKVRKRESPGEKEIGTEK
jgi:cytochrome b561